MGQFFLDYGLFLAQTVTIVVAIGVVIALIAGAASKKSSVAKESIEIKSLNKRYDEIKKQIQSEILEKAEFKKLQKQAKEKDKAKKAGAQQSEAGQRHKIFVLDFKGDIRASAVTNLREEITALLMVAGEGDQVFVRLESGGGMVHSYGLAASQLMRVRDRGIPLTVAVDKVAASGGYMMACVANKLIAAPFAIIGSIGVLAQVPNFNKVLKKHDIEYEEFTAGEFKRTVTIFGENSKEAKEKFQEELNDIHILFQDFVIRHRPDINVSKVATGEHWPATRAKDMNLVDELKTSDDYLLAQSEVADLYLVKHSEKKSLADKFGIQAQLILDKIRFG